MSLISQTTSYTAPGTYTYTIPQGVGSLEFHLWGAGGAAGGGGPSIQVQTDTTATQVQTGTHQVTAGTVQVQSGTQQVQTGTHSVQSGTTQVQSGTTQVQSGTTQVQTGTTQVQTGTTQQAYRVSVPATNNKGQAVTTTQFINGGRKTQVPVYNTVTQYRTVPVYTTVPTYTTVPVYTTVPTFTDQAVFATVPDYTTVPTYTTQPIYSTVTDYTTVYTPVYSTVSGGQGGLGGGGGYASRTIQVHYGDVIVIYVGSAGLGATGGLSTNFNGGASAAATAGSSGGGGGAATVITVNGVVVAMAAGGGGGGGGGISGATGTAGSPATISGIGSGSQGSGISSVAGPATGGGGGGGFYSGIAGTSGTKGAGGQGGVCYGTVIQGGSGTAPGGIALPQYPGRNVGYASYSGAAMLVFNKSFNINVKRNGQWDVVNSAWVKVGGNWKALSNGWTKVSGVWKPLISPDAILGAENLTTPVITYLLSADSASISEGAQVVFTLATTGLSAGTIVPYTASGLDAATLTGALFGHFVVGTTDSVAFTTIADHATTGTRTLRVSIDNTTAIASCTVLDTSLTAGYGLSANQSTINEGGSVTFTLTTANTTPGEVIPYSVTGISAADLSSGALTGNFVVGTTDSVTFTLASDSLTEGTETLTITLHGRPGTASCSILDTSQTPYVPPVIPDPIIAGYSLSANQSTINEGGSVTFTLSTTNVANGTAVSYSVTGISDADLASGSRNGAFVVGSTNSISFTLANDFVTEGVETLGVTLVGKGVGASCNIVDTSTSPAAHGSETLSGSSTFSVPAGVVSLNVTLIAGGGAGGYSSRAVRQYSGGGGGSGGRLVTTMAVSPFQAISYSVGIGGSTSGSAGTGSSFGPYSATGGGGGGNGIANSAGVSAVGGAGGSPGGEGGGAGGVAVNPNAAGGGAGGGSTPGGAGNSNGASGSSVGAGGGGAGVAQVNNSTVNNAYSGGSGANGSIILTW